MAGLFVSTESIHGLADIVAAINAATGDISAAALINAGLLGIGIRGAL